jgi:hypothetical protein
MDAPSYGVYTPEWRFARHSRISLSNKFDAPRRLVVADNDIGIPAEAVDNMY